MRGGWVGSGVWDKVLKKNVFFYWHLPLNICCLFIGFKVAAYLQSYMLTKKPSLHPKSKVLSIASRTSHTYPETRQKSNFLLVRPGNWLHSTKFVFILGWKYFCCLITTFLNQGIRVSCQPPSFLSFFESGSTIDSRSTIDSGLGQTEAVTMIWPSLTYNRFSPAFYSFKRAAEVKTNFSGQITTQCSGRAKKEEQLRCQSMNKWFLLLLTLIVMFMMIIIITLFTNTVL